MENRKYFIFLQKSEQKDFKNWIYDRYLLFYRYGFLAYLIVYCSYSYVDSIFYPELIKYSILFRLLIGLPVLSLPIILSYTKYYKKNLFIINALSSTAVTVSLVFLHLIFSQSKNNLLPVFYGGLILQTLLIGLLNSHFMFSFISSFFVFLVFLISSNLFLVNESNLNQLVQENILLAVSCAVASLISFFYHNIENKARLDEEALLLKKNEIEEKNLELANLNCTKDKLFSIISHDLKSPLSGMIGLLNFMTETNEEMTSTETKEYLLHLSNSANNLFKLICDLLDWSRLSSGNMVFEPKDAELSEIIKANISLFTEKANQKEIYIIPHIQDTYHLECDFQMINSVLRNLISNSLKFTQRNGRIEIGVNELSDENGLEVFVRDNGIGINKETLDKLFKIEEKVSTPGTENEPGTGLGLVLCKDFVEKHGGTLFCESEPNKGTTFKFTLPRNRNLNKHAFESFEVA